MKIRVSEIIAAIVGKKEGVSVEVERDFFGGIQLSVYACPRFGGVRHFVWSVCIPGKEFIGSHGDNPEIDLDGKSMEMLLHRGSLMCSVASEASVRFDSKMQAMLEECIRESKERLARCAGEDDAKFLSSYRGGMQ